MLRPWKRPKPEHRKVERLQDAVTLFAERNVSAAVIWRNGQRGLSIEPGSLLEALLALPEPERLPAHLEEYLAAARTETAREDLDNHTRYLWAVPLTIAGSYLIGLEGDRRGSLTLLRESHRQWLQAQGTG